MEFKTVDPEECYPLNLIHEYVLERDNGLCQLCGSVGDQKHHIKFRSQGGDDRPNNLVLLCVMCHNQEHSNGGLRSAILEKRAVKNEESLRKRLV